MPLLEAAASKALSAGARFLPQLCQRVEARIITDHKPISAAHTYLDGGRFWLSVAVAPSHSPRRLESLDFIENANELAELIFGDLPFKNDHISSEGARFVVSNSNPTASFPRHLHMLRISPLGLIDLQWGLEVFSLPDSRDMVLSLDEIVNVLGHLYDVAHSPRFSGVHKRRRTERIRRLDWQVGLTPSIAPTTDGPIYRRGFRSTRCLPAGDPINTQPWCPITGYASDLLRNVKAEVPAAEVFGPVLRDMLVNAGYLAGVRECVSDALSGILPGKLALVRQLAAPGLDATTD